MGVPKFYRWISERYPCLSEVVKEYQIPEFDNLYLDMNGIIHICSHPNDNDPHFRITEEKIFKDIFHYIEVLFRLIRPREVFFMAVDGVAPRAKMNQQRSRRFRSAREAVESEKRAKERGEDLPKEARFDSNCITPGTEFMARLDAQLQYFVTSKVSHDKMWQNCKIIYSGHQTPGEGEHKIMEYIRHSKSQQDYNPNIRHCLYGLDADLIMLGLTSHEPHFSLLREEVRFGGKKQQSSRTATIEETTFHLLHLSLMREYINYEFSSLQTTLPFPYDLECILDDWVMMGFLVGNDFIPHLPHLHINKEALPILYSKYKEVLPTLDGYLNQGGTLHLGRFEKFMAKLAEFDVEQFQETNADLKYFNKKRLKDGKAFGPKKGKESENPFDVLGEEEDDDEEMPDLCKTLAKLNYTPDPEFMLDDEYDDDDEDMEVTEFRQHKRDYYKTKMHLLKVDEKALANQATSYVRGIQWILHYYYDGICSWSWYYPFHYSPYISDIKDFADMKMEFELGEAFLPYEQLLGVLPPLSQELLSPAYRGLMVNIDSPLKEFYPDDFETDLNGKQQDWEAVVLIPFLDEKKLLEAMNQCNEKLTKEERKRNKHGPMYVYTYTPENLGEYQAPKLFPPVSINHALMKLVWRKEWEINPADIYKGLCKGVRQDLYFAGFPTLKHIPHKFHIYKAGVKVFQQNSRGDNFILDIIEKQEIPDMYDLANQMLRKEIFVSWPHLVEAKVVSLSDGNERYTKDEEEIVNTPLNGSQKDEFFLTRDLVATHYHDRYGINVGDIPVLVYAVPMTGRKYVAAQDGMMTLEKEWSKVVQGYALQAVVQDIGVHDPNYKLHMTPQEYFPTRTKIFMLGQPHYGCMGEVIEIDPNHKGRIRVAMTVNNEPNFDPVKDIQHQLGDSFMTAYYAAQKVGVSPQLLARLTGTVFLAPPKSLANSSGMEPNEGRSNRINIGLNLKNNRKSEEVSGYSKKTTEQGISTWKYSEKAVEAVLHYQRNFPEIFEHMAGFAGQNDVFYQDEVFGADKYKERVAELTDWLKNADFAKAERQPCGTKTLGEAVVKRLVEELDKVATVRARVVKMQVRPHLLFKPNPLQGSSPPDPTVQYKLFDRVINIREGFSVPLGARGTVIGIQPAEKDADVLYDVLFDEPFVGGLTLRGEASSSRCYRLHWASLINTSHGNRTPGSTTSHRVANLHQNNVPMENQWRKPIQHHHYQQQQQYRPANNYNNQYTSPMRWPIKSQVEKEVITLHSNSQPPNIQTHPVIVQRNPLSTNTPHSQNHLARNNKTGYSQSGNVTASGVSQTNKATSSPQPPDPNQLPSPSALRPANNTANTAPVPVMNGDMTQHRVMQSPSPGSHLEKPVLLRSPDEVEVVVHGTYYATWNRILNYGLTSSSRGFIPCFPFVPVEKMGPRSFQLFIFINVRAAMADGIKFFKTSERQILCSGRSKGILPAKYFSKVVDAETRSIIYPLQHNSHAFGPGPHNQSGPRPSGGWGRGRGGGSEQSQPIQLYQDIWSQVQRMDSDKVDLRPVQTQMLTQILNIQPDSPISAPPPPSQPKAQTRELTVQDIFQGVSAHAQQSAIPPKASMGDTNILSLFSGAQPTYHHSHHLPSQPDNGSNNNNTSHKSSSPAKSAFVPTQVIRNQTPRKPKGNSSDTHTDSQGCVTGAQSLDNHKENQQQTTTQHQHQQDKDKNPAHLTASPFK
ncbi:hypothetical protein Pcinc_035435 [Petrolisthes cinctipes]|uniref:5'-3' exoribonuclease 1 n=1 Tax=Petrolisthes cinctipes TaxID=88211 RepID=A0AAE1ENB9_PETCI|nr:hypothetical protein Pcinc_035435 [Petrolisthes cinctipes]